MEGDQDFERLLCSLTSLSLEVVEIDAPTVENESPSPRFPWDELDKGDEGSKTALVYDERMALHKNIWSKNHPERPGRVEETMRVLNECGILKRVRTVCAREVTKQEALRCHSETLWTTLESLEEMKPRDLYRLTDEFDSVYFNNNSFLAARLAAGSLISVTDEVLSGRAHNGVAVIRPPGHHAETDKPMGFCLLGNVPIACCHAMDKYGLKRILVVDWDIHHGNGTQETFYNDARVLYVSLHRYDHGAFYPGGPGPHPDKIGGEGAKGYNMNIAWNQTHKKDGDYMSAFHQLIMPVVQEFDPELVYISAGFDSGQGDPLGLTDVTPEGYSRMTHLLSNAAGGKVIVALEGGYKLSTVAEGMKSCALVLLGEPPLFCDPTARVATPGGMKSILESVKYICPYWKNLAHYKEIFSLIPEKPPRKHKSKKKHNPSPPYPSSAPLSPRAQSTPPPSTLPTQSTTPPPYTTQPNIESTFSQTPHSPSTPDLTTLFSHITSQATRSSPRLANKPKRKSPRKSPSLSPRREYRSYISPYPSRQYRQNNSDEEV